MKDEKKYYIEVTKDDFILSEILKFFNGYVHIANKIGANYTTIHHNFHYRGISDSIALKIDRGSNGKFKATEIAGMKFSKNENLKYLQK